MRPCVQVPVSDQRYDAILRTPGDPFTRATFDEFKVPETEQRELLALLLPVRNDIVEVKSRRPRRRFRAAISLRRL
jgi:hypothetical protein